LITARTACMHRDHQHSVAGLSLFNMISSSSVLLRFTTLHIDQCDTYRRCRRRKGSRTTSRRRSTIGRWLWLALRCTGWWCGCEETWTSDAHSRERGLQEVSGLAAPRIRHLGM
jgi:hypothetical protein